MKLKDELLLASADNAKERSQEFKARPLNKKIFERAEKLPYIDRK